MKKRNFLLLLSSALILTALILSFWHFQNQGIRLKQINDHLDAGGIQLGMLESEVIRLWGPGEYLYGMGGHLRDYKDKNIRVGFSDDSDNDLYQKVSSLEISNSDFSIFSVKVGDDWKAGADKILSKGFKAVDNSNPIFVNGEYFISITGQEKIESIKIWFADKDLRDRVY
jgi:hypothetical protein